jgi:hypothetical protein
MARIYSKLEILTTQNLHKGPFATAPKVAAFEIAAVAKKVSARAKIWR